MASRAVAPSHGGGTHAPRPPFSEQPHTHAQAQVWALIISCTLKYQVFMMSVGFHGQGGLFALLNNLKWRGDLQRHPRTWRFFQARPAVAGPALAMTKFRRSAPTTPTFLPPSSSVMLVL